MLLPVSPDAHLVARLQAVLRAGPPMRLALLFGSAATGILRPDSDIDVAILPGDASLSLAAELALQAELSRAVGREVDLVRLDHAPTLVKWQVAKNGIPLLAADGVVLSRFLATTAGEYFDFAPALERAQERFRRRLIAGAGRPA